MGMIRRSNGNLHYLINGLDQGIAAKVPAGVWGVIDRSLWYDCESNNRRSR